MNYALIENGIVTNIIVLLPYNLKDFPHSIRVNDLAVRIGDSYNAEENRFYHDGEPICSIQEQLSDAQNALSILGYTEDEGGTE